MMTASSRAGYFTSKAPSLMLQEQLAADRRVKARVKVIEKGEGRWGCKVVLPHEKKQELDTVVFLPEQLLCDDRDVAYEVGALVALHSISGTTNDSY